MNPVQLFALFTVLAFALMAAEVFLPGGVLGVLGAMCLIAACVFSFKAFGGSMGLLVTALLLVGTVVGMFVWLIALPNTYLGKRLTLQNDLHSSKSTRDQEEALVGHKGTAETDLRPSGYARIDGRRRDVVTQRDFVPQGTPVKVVAVHGMRIVVEPEDAPEAT